MNKKIPPRPKLYTIYRTTDLKDNSIYYNIYLIQRETVLWGINFGPNGDKVELVTSNVRYWNDFTEKEWEESGVFDTITEQVSNYGSMTNKSKASLFNLIFLNHKDSNVLYR